MSGVSEKYGQDGVCRLCRRAVFFFFVLLLLGIAACDSTETGPYSPYTVAGISADRIRLGSSLPLTGHASFLGTQTLRGALSYIKTVNAAGGIHDRYIELDARDDGYDPPRCLANTQQFLISQDIFALFGYVGTPTTVRILPMVEEAGIPLLGMLTGANALREPFNPFVWNVRASYYQETRALVDYLVQERGLSRIAVFYQYDAYGFDGLTGTELALREHGLAPVARGSYVRGTVDVANAVARIAEAGPEAIVLVGTYEPCARFIRQAERAGVKAVFCNLSFVGGNELVRRLGSAVRSTVLMTQVVPPPLDARAPQLMTVVTEYIRDLQRWFPHDVPDAIGFEGYINARILIEGLRRAGRELTRERFMSALDSIDSYSLGGTTTVSFGPRDHQGLENVYFTILDNEQFILLSDGTVFSDSREQEAAR